MKRVKKFAYDSAALLVILDTDGVVHMFNKGEGNISYSGKLELKSAVRNVFVFHGSLCVVADNFSAIYTGANKLVFRQETYLNATGVCDASDSNLLCLGLQRGSVRLAAILGGPSWVVAAHNSAIVALAIRGMLVATASEVGTLIRLFSVQNGALLCELRRSTSFLISPSPVSKLSISEDEQFVASLDASGQVCVFKVPPISTLLESAGSSPISSFVDYAISKKCIPGVYSDALFSDSLYLLDTSGEFSTLPMGPKTTLDEWTVVESNFEVITS